MWNYFFLKSKISQLSFWPPLALNSTPGVGGLPWAGRGTRSRSKGSRELREAAGRAAAAEVELLQHGQCHRSPEPTQQTTGWEQARAQEFARLFSSTQTAKFLLGIQGLVETASPCPSAVPYIPEGAQHEPTALAEAGSKLCSKEQLGVSGCVPFPGQPCTSQACW